MKLTDAIVGILGGRSSCPDCGSLSLMEGQGCCGECGYDSEGEEEEEDEEEEDENMSLQELLDVKDDLQRLVEKVNRLIVKNGS